MARQRQVHLIDDEEGWKPEPESDPELSQENQGPRSLIAPGISRVAYRGALTIVECQSNPLTVILIRDNDKYKIRFPFGGIQPDDPDPPNGSRRETKEEVGLGIGPLAEKNYVGELSGGPNCTIYIFAKKMPAEARDDVVLGEEQIDHAAMLFGTIDRYIKLGLISRNHCNAWKKFLQWRETHTDY